MIVSVAAADVASIQPTTAAIRTTQQGVGRRETVVLPGKGFKWHRKFTGQHVMTPPRMHYKLKTFVNLNSDLKPIYLQDYIEFKKHIRPTLHTDVTVSLNNTPLTVNDQRLLRQKGHLDAFSESMYRTYPYGERSNNDDGQTMTRQMMPVRTYSQGHLIDEDSYITVANIYADHGAIGSSGNPAQITILKGFVEVAEAWAYVPANTSTWVALRPLSSSGAWNYDTKSIRIPTDGDFTMEVDHGGSTVRAPVRLYNMLKFGASNTQTGNESVYNHASTNLSSSWEFEHDVYQDLQHPYFDQPLSNVLFMDVEVTQPTLEVGSLYQNRLSSYQTIVLSIPTLTFDLITPTTLMPVTSTYMIDTYRDTVRPAIMPTSGADTVVAGPIHTEQVPDAIYVFVRNDTVLNPSENVPDRLAVILSLQFITPQGTDLATLDQDTLYHMSKRNGVRQNRDEFMCSKGSLICINPEVDLGGYVNGVLMKNEFSIKVRYERAYRSGGESIVWKSDLQDQHVARKPAFDDVGNDYKVHVVMKQANQLILKGDGTGQLTSSMIQPNQVAQEKMYHPSLIKPGTKEIDGGVLGQL
jgi:hypothetical protein